jgi:integral membrane protein (TIGR01906 family)
MVIWDRVPDSMLRRVATVLFVLSIPLLLITSNVRWAANESRLYEYSLDHYDAEARSGIARVELDYAARDLIRYFNDDRPTIQTLVTQAGQPVPLYNERETSHLHDVKDLFRAVFRVQEASLAFALVYVVGVFVWAGEAPLRLLARTVLATSAFTLGLLGLAAVGTLVNFDELWTKFHLLAFTNDLWKLDPNTDHLIQMFPEDFWLDATLLVAGLTAVEALALLAAATAYLRLRLHWWMAVPVGQPGA